MILIAQSSGYLLCVLSDQKSSLSPSCPQLALKSANSTNLCQVTTLSPAFSRDRTGTKADRWAWPHPHGECSRVGRQREKITTFVCIPWGSIELFLPLLSQQLLVEHLLYLGSLHILVCLSKESPFLVQVTLVNRIPSHGDWPVWGQEGIHWWALALFWHYLKWVPISADMSVSQLEPAD